MCSPHERQRPRSAAYDTSGTFSIQESSCPHVMQAEPGLTIERRSGTRAATTLRNEPSARPGASASAANVTSARACEAVRRGRVRRRVLRLPLRPRLLVALERERDQGRAGVDELRPRGRRLRDDDVRRVAGRAAGHLPGEAGVLELALCEDEGLP